MNAALIEQIKGGIKGLIRQRMDWVRDAKKSRAVLNWVHQLPDFPEAMEFKQIDETTIMLRHPYNKVVRQQVHEYLLSLGWKVYFERNESQCKNSWDDPFITYINEQMPISHDSFLKLQIIYDDILKESTCKRKLIGKQKVEREESIYEWVCEDALQEEANGE